MISHSRITSGVARGLGALLLLLASAACGAAGALGGATATPPSQLVVDRPNASFGSGPFNYTDVSAGLADLPSYKATLVLTFDGTAAGKPQKWTRTYVTLASKDPAAYALTIDKTGDVLDAAPVFMAEVDGVAYERHGEDACTATAILDGATIMNRFGPATFLPGLTGADEAGSEKVNSVDAKHYTFDQHAIGQDGITQSTGEVWVASTGGYVVKYLLTTKGQAEYFGQGNEGTLTEDYELTGVGEPAKIEMPAACPAGKVDAPLLPDAANVSQWPGGLSFDSATSLKDAAAFYQKELPKAGWKVQKQDTAVSKDTAYLRYLRNDEDLIVVIAPQGSGITVSMSLVRVQQK
jgi:hypothetical protein